MLPCRIDERTEVLIKLGEAIMEQASSQKDMLLHFIRRKVPLTGMSYAGVRLAHDSKPANKSRGEYHAAEFVGQYAQRTGLDEHVVLKEFLQMELAEVLGLVRPFYFGDGTRSREALPDAIRSLLKRDELSWHLLNHKARMNLARALWARLTDPREFLSRLYQEQGASVETDRMPDDEAVQMAFIEICCALKLTQEYRDF